MTFLLILAKYEVWNAWKLYFFRMTAKILFLSLTVEAYVEPFTGSSQI